MRSPTFCRFGRVCELRSLASRSSHGEDGFLDLGYGEMADRLQVDMRKVGHLVGWHDGIDDRRASTLNASLIAVFSSPAFVALNP